MAEETDEIRDRLLREHGQDRRYAGDVPNAVHLLLKDVGARMKGCPQWNRDEDAELYDAIVLIRDMIVRANNESYPDESPFNIGSSYQRWISSWLSSKYDLDVFAKVYANNDPKLTSALDVIDRRVAKMLAS